MRSLRVNFECRSVTSGPAFRTALLAAMLGWIAITPALVADDATDDQPVATVVHEEAEVQAESDAPSRGAAVRSGGNADAQIGFSTPRSVEGTLAETAELQQEGALSRFRAGKQELEDRTGFAYGFDNQTQYLGTDADKSPSDGFSNVFRIYGTWTASGRGTPNAGALIFKIEDRSAVGSNISTQALGPSLGYAGVFSSTYSDAGVVLTNLYWRKHFAEGRGGLVIGQVDTYDYVNVNGVSSPWTAFTNLAFEQQPTFAGPSQGLGAAVRWRLTDHWQVLGGFANANGDASEPFESAKKLFDTGETFKHLAIGWTPTWGGRYDYATQLTVWQIDERKEAGVEGGYGVSFATSAYKDKWRPFLRIGYAHDAGTLLDRAISIGTAYDARGGSDLAGLAVGWGRAPDNSRNQYELEAFYRYGVTDFLQITPEIQYVVNPAFDPETDQILVFGVRLRAFF